MSHFLRPFSFLALTLGAPAALVAAILAGSAALVPSTARASERSDRGGPRFDDGVAAVFRRRCVRCHGADDPEADLRLDSYDGVMRGGEQGPSVVGGDPTNSLLYQKVTRRTRPAMPPKSRLSPQDLEIIRAWIDGGALP
jgi:mono/diheme cytochrome c family protein